MEEPMAVNSSSFINLLKELEFPGAAALDEKQLDYLFQDESCKEFLTWFCKNVSKENLLTDDQIQRFRSGTGPVLQGKHLDDALSDLRKKEKLPSDPQPSSQEQRLKECQKLSDHLERLVNDADQEERELREKEKDAHNALVCAERRLAEAEATTETVKDRIHKQIASLQEINKEGVSANCCSLNPLSHELSKFDDQIMAFMKKYPSLDFKALLKATEENLSSNEIRDYAGTFDCKKEREKFLGDVQTLQQHIFMNYCDQKIENAKLKAEMARLIQLEKTHHSSNTEATGSSVNVDSNLDDLISTMNRKRQELPEIKTPYSSQIAIRELNQEMLLHSFAWEMCNKIEEWICERLSIGELVDFCLQQECRAIGGLQRFLEDFLAYMMEKDVSTLHSLDLLTSIKETENENDPSADGSARQPLNADSDRLFKKVEDAINRVKRVNDVTERPAEDEYDKLKSAVRKVKGVLVDVKKKEKANAQLLKESSKLQKFLDRELWMYFYVHPERLGTIVEKWT